MFYNTDILAHRKGGFAVFWLAATIGARGTGAVRKLSKKELLSCNIVRACEKVIQPDEPLALRLSANLLFGISRVFSHKYTLYANDVQQVQQALRKVITEAAITMPDITLAPELAAVAAELRVPPGVAAPREVGIDLQLRPHAVVDAELDWELGLDWELPGVAAPPAEEFREEMFVSPIRAVIPAPVRPEAPPVGAYQAREAEITLEEPQLYDYMLEGYPGPELAPPARPVFAEEERGLLEGISPELDRALREAAPAAPPAFEVSSELGGLEEQYFPELAEREETLAQRVRREHEEARARLEAPLRRSPTPLAKAELTRELLEVEETPSITTRKRVSDAVSLAQVKAQEIARKVKRPRLLPIDTNTELEDVVLRRMRDEYADRMQDERDAAARRARDLDAHQRAMELVFGPPAFLGAPELTNFWRSDVAGQLTPFEGGKAADEKKRRAAGLPPTERLPRGPVEVMRRAAAERLSEIPPGAAVPRAFPEEVFLPEEYGGFEQLPFEEEVERGRAVSIAARSPSLRPSIIPWAAEVPTSEVGGPPPFVGPPSAAAVSRVSMEAPVIGRRAPSLLLSPARAPSIEGLLGPEEAQLIGFEERPFARSPLPRPSLVGPEAPPTLEPGLRETESLKLLSYARRQQRVGERLYFSDIVPPAETNASTAAQAMYHLLCLATKGLVKVEQETAYGEIAVDIQ